MVGRTRDGDPLVPIEEAPIPGIGSKPEELRLNQFTYARDPTGSACPFGAHIRRANPRNPDFPGRPTALLKRIITMLGFGPKGFRDDLMSPVRFHRILRRGREYGPGQAGGCATPGSGDEPRAAFISSASMPTFPASSSSFRTRGWREHQVLRNNRGERPAGGDPAEIPGCPVTGFSPAFRRRSAEAVPGMPQFVTVRGGAYFFLPSLRALRYFAAVRSG